MRKKFNNKYASLWTYNNLCNGEHELVDVSIVDTIGEVRKVCHRCKWRVYKEEIVAGIELEKKLSRIKLRREIRSAHIDLFQH